MRSPGCVLCWGEGESSGALLGLGHQRDPTSASSGANCQHMPREKQTEKGQSPLKLGARDFTSKFQSTPPFFTPSLIPTHSEDRNLSFVGSYSPPKKALKPTPASRLEQLRERHRTSRLCSWSPPWPQAWAPQSQAPWLSTPKLPCSVPQGWLTLASAGLASQPFPHLKTGPQRKGGVRSSTLL